VLVAQGADVVVTKCRGRNVPTGMLYGSVVEPVDMSVEEMQGISVRLVGSASPPYGCDAERCCRNQGDSAGAAMVQ
jgi:hypothetical protein